MRPAARGDAPPPGLRPEVRAAWLEAQSEYARSCGCEEGAWGAALGMLLATLTLLLHRPRSEHALWIAPLVLAGWGVAGAALGRLAGLRAARRRFETVTAKLAGSTRPSATVPIPEAS